ncbi:MAG: hypothetical protein Q8L81_01530 [Bacteroidota bacterium]|nr:hypothetical protein [Bacteroidota bacterium]
MERQELIDFIILNGTENDKAVDLQELSDFQLRSIAQRIISETRLKTTWFEGGPAGKENLAAKTT